MKYFVNVVNVGQKFSQEFLISIVPDADDRKNLLVGEVFNGKNTGNDPNLCYQIALAEYEHCIKRMERLDNKIYILLTACAFIFVALTNALSFIRNFKVATNCIEFTFIVTYVLFALFCSYKVVLLLTNLVRCLSTIPVNRFDSSEILQRSMVFADKKKVVEYVIAKYEEEAEINNKLIAARYKEVDKCVRALVFAVIFVVILTAIGNFIPQAKENEVTFANDVVTHIVEAVIQVFKN